MQGTYKALTSMCSTIGMNSGAQSKGLAAVAWAMGQWLRPGQNSACALKWEASARGMHPFGPRDASL